MKETIFHILDRTTGSESKDKTRKLDYIYEPNDFGRVKFDDERIYVITTMMDEFPGNEAAQTRHIHVIEHEADGNILP